MKLKPADTWLDERMMDPIHGDAVRFTADEIRDVQRNVVEAAADAVSVVGVYGPTSPEDMREHCARAVRELIPENPAPAEEVTP